VVQGTKWLHRILNSLFPAGSLISGTQNTEFPKTLERNHHNFQTYKSFWQWIFQKAKGPEFFFGEANLSDDTEEYQDVCVSVMEKGYV
jgi:hypothetical protein